MSKLAYPIFIKSNTDLEGDEDDEVGEVEAEDLAAGAGAAHHLQRSGQEGSLLGSGQGCNTSYNHITTQTFYRQT